MNAILRRLALVPLLLALTALARPVQAHRVNVFAYVEGDVVFVECSYSKSQKVNKGAITVTDAATGQVYLTGVTDDQGNFTFTAPREAKDRKADLRITLIAGEGHQNDWTVEAKEYLQAAPDAKDAPAAEAAPAASQAAPAPAAAPGATRDRDLCDEATLSRLVETALETKIAPLRRILIEDKEAGPGLTEIVGGVGWIVGLAGLAAYLKSRKG